MLEHSDTATDYHSKAIGLLSKRLTPDYENTVKEAISAVEALLKEENGDRGASLAAAVKKAACTKV